MALASARRLRKRQVSPLALRPRTKTIKDLLPKFDNWVDEFAWGRDSTSIFFASGTEGEAPVFSVDVASKNFLRYATGIPEGEFGALQPLPDGRAFLATRVTVDKPSEVVAVRFGAHPQYRPLTGAIQGTLLGNPQLPRRFERIVSSHPPQRRPPRPTRPPQDGILLVHRRRRHQGPGLPHPPARLRPRTKNTPSNSSFTAARKAHGATCGPTAGTPNSSPPTATSSS